MNNLNKIQTAVIAALLAILLYIFLQPKKIDTGDLLKEKERQHKARIDSLEKVISVIERKDLALENAIIMERQARQKAINETQAYKRKLRQIESRPSPVLSSEEINEKLELRYPGNDTVKIQVVKRRVESALNDLDIYDALKEYSLKLEQENEHSARLIHVQDSSLNVKEEMISAQRNLIKELEGRFENQKALTKAERSQKRKWRFVAILEGAAIIYLVSKLE